MKQFDYMSALKKAPTQGDAIDFTREGIFNDPIKMILTPWGEEVHRLLKMYLAETGQAKKPITDMMKVVSKKRVYDGRAYYEMSFSELVSYEGFWVAAKKAFEYSRTVLNESNLVKSYYKFTGSRFRIETQSGIEVITDLNGVVITIDGMNVEEYFEWNPDAEARMMDRPAVLQYRDWEACMGESVKTAYRIK